MISYRDRLFCASTACPRFVTCPRAATSRIKRAAAAANLPLSIGACYQKDGQCSMGFSTKEPEK